MLRPEAKRTMDSLNLNLMDDIWTDDVTGMPIVGKCGIVPTSLVPFDKAKRLQYIDAMVHFFIEDYAFNRIWNQPNKYIGLLSKFSCVASPDFSTYFDMPEPLIRMQLYKRRLLTQWYQRSGLNVVYNVQTMRGQWDDYQFEGVEKGGVLISRPPLQYANNSEGRYEFIRTVHAACERLHPNIFLIYGYNGNKENLPTNINFKFYENDYIRIRRANARRQREILVG